MADVKKLIKEGKLAEYLMEDSKFFEGAKKILREENIDVTTEDLKVILKAVEKTVSENRVLEDDELEQIAGGVSAKSIGRKTIKGITVGAGAILGAALTVSTGALLGAVADMYIAEKKGMVLKKGEETKCLGVRTVFGSSATGSIGLVYGGKEGYRLGKWICKKFGLEEENKD